MNLEQIKLALAQGKRVFWATENYEVLKSIARDTGKDMYQIVCDNGYAIGLTWLDVA